MGWPEGDSLSFAPVTGSSPTRRKILVAVAWPYASGLRHIGHVAGFGVPSDTFARYHRLRGNDVLMVSGTDEHGTPVMVAADDAGESPRETADRFNAFIREDLRDLGLSYDLFTRTTTKNHYSVTRDVFRTLYEKGYVIEKETLGAFSASTGHTLPDRYIEGTCPICGFTAARGDQCDNCGNQLDPTDLIEPRSRIDGTRPVFETTKHLFLDLPAFKDQLTDWIGAKDAWRPNVRRFSLNFVQELKPRPITRDLDWGVPIPVEGYDDGNDKRIYVWFDAVIGYLSASIEWAANRGSPEAWRDWWQNPDAEHAYFMGKDNIVFHTVIWPSMLLGYGSGGEVRGGSGRARSCPTTSASSEFLTMEGKKFSSSRGVQIHVRDFLSRYDAGRSSLLPDHRRPRDAGHGLHVVRVRSPEQRRARRDVGQSREPHAPERAQELRGGPDARRARGRGRGAPPRGRAGLRDGRVRSSRPRASRRASQEAMRLARRRQPVRGRAGAVGAARDRS